jgi:hypothetical protein
MKKMNSGCRAHSEKFPGIGAESFNMPAIIGTWTSR